MTFNTYNDKFRDDSNSCSSSSSTSDEYLMSLLRRPLICFDEQNVSSSHSYFHPPFSFEEPFDDPTMEPMPLRMSGSTVSHARCSSESMLKRDDSLASPFFLEVEKPRKEADFRQNMVDMSIPMFDFVGSKRSTMDSVTSQDNGPVDAKRQRTNLAPTNTSSQGYKTRFRPSQEELWRTQFQKLVQFKYNNGHCRVPHDFPEDQTLSRWVKRQRYQYKRLHDNNPGSTMTTSRIHELESIGFIWNSHITAWQDKFDELKIFKQRTGHCNVPSHFPENDALTSWVKCQRRQGKRYISGRSCNITKERFEALKALGFVFDPRAAKHQTTG